MKRTTLLIREGCHGWHLIDRDEPILWFPEKEAALHVAGTIAEARNFYIRATHGDGGGGRQPLGTGGSEMALADFLFIHHRATNQRVTVKELLALESSNAKKTLGALLEKTKDLSAFDQDAIDRLELALEHRDRLSNHFFKDHGESFLSTSGREKMLDALSEFQRSLQIADTLIEAANSAMSKAIGVTDEIVQKELSNIYAYAAND